jgi:hypothetical protein
MSDSPQAVRPEDIVEAYQGKETLKLLTEALGDGDEDRRRRARDLQTAARASRNNEQDCQLLQNELESFSFVMGRFQERTAVLFSQIENARQDAYTRMVKAAINQRTEFSEFLLSDKVERERLLLLDAMKHVAGLMTAVRRDLRAAEIETDRCKSEYFNCLADFLAAETLRKAAAAAAFEGELAIDPNSGRSGEARKLAVHHLGRYREQKGEQRDATTPTSR